MSGHDGRGQEQQQPPPPAGGGNDDDPLRQILLQYSQLAAATGGTGNARAGVEGGVASGVGPDPAATASASASASASAVVADQLVGELHSTSIPGGGTSAFMPAPAPASASAAGGTSSGGASSGGGHTGQQQLFGQPQLLAHMDQQHQHQQQILTQVLQNLQQQQPMSHLYGGMGLQQQQQQDSSSRYQQQQQSQQSHDVGIVGLGGNGTTGGEGGSVPNVPPPSSTFQQQSIQFGRGVGHSNIAGEGGAAGGVGGLSDIGGIGNTTRTPTEGFSDMVASAKSFELLLQENLRQQELLRLQQEQLRQRGQQQPLPPGRPPSFNLQNFQQPRQNRRPQPQQAPSLGGRQTKPVSSLQNSTNPQQQQQQAHQRGKTKDGASKLLPLSTPQLRARQTDEEGGKNSANANAESEFKLPRRKRSRRVAKNNKQSAAREEEAAALKKVEAALHAGEDDDQVPPSSSAELITPTDTDVVFCRSDPHAYASNQIFCTIVDREKRAYMMTSSKIRKGEVVKAIMNEVRSLSPPGRFLSKDDKRGDWYVINDKKVRINVSQAIKDSYRRPRKEMEAKIEAAEDAGETYEVGNDEKLDTVTEDEKAGHEDEGEPNDESFEVWKGRVLNSIQHYQWPKEAVDTFDALVTLVQRAQGQRTGDGPGVIDLLWRRMQGDHYIDDVESNTNEGETGSHFLQEDKESAHIWRELFHKNVMSDAPSTRGSVILVTTVKAGEDSHAQNAQLIIGLAVVENSNGIIRHVVAETVDSSRKFAPLIQKGQGQCYSNVESWFAALPTLAAGNIVSGTNEANVPFMKENSWKHVLVRVPLKRYVSYVRRDPALKSTRIQYVDAPVRGDNEHIISVEHASVLPLPAICTSPHLDVSQVKDMFGFLPFFFFREGSRTPIPRPLLTRPDDAHLFHAASSTITSHQEQLGLTDSYIFLRNSIASCRKVSPHKSRATTRDTPDRTKKRKRGSRSDVNAVDPSLTFYPEAPLGQLWLDTVRKKDDDLVISTWKVGLSEPPSLDSGGNALGRRWVWDEGHYADEEEEDMTMKQWRDKKDKLKDGQLSGHASIKNLVSDGLKLVMTTAEISEAAAATTAAAAVYAKTTDAGKKNQDIPHHLRAYCLCGVDHSDPAIVNPTTSSASLALEKAAQVSASARKRRSGRQQGVSVSLTNVLGELARGELNPHTLITCEKYVGGPDLRFLCDEDFAHARQPSISVASATIGQVDSSIAKSPPAGNTIRTPSVADLIASSRLKADQVQPFSIKVCPGRSIPCRPSCSFIGK